MGGVFDWLFGKSKREGPTAPAGPDLYEILRVSPAASEGEIKAAFRDLAIKFHPDRNPNDPVAEQRYREVASAYTILSDSTQRAAYDAARSSQALPPGESRGIILPPPPESIVSFPEVIARPKRKTQDPSVYKQILGPEKKGAKPLPNLWDVVAGKKSPPRIPSAESIYAPLMERAKRVPVSPGVDVPTLDELYQHLQHWPLDAIWDLVRSSRGSPAFINAGAMAIDSIAGSTGHPAEWDLSEMFDIPLRQTEEFVKHRGRQAFFSEILYPMFNNVTQVLGQIKPADIPGQFFLDWDPTGKVIELVYAEDVGRKQIR